MTAREVLEARRTAEREMAAIRRQIALTEESGGPKGFKTGGNTEKIPGTDDYVMVGRQTNNPEGMRLQHYDGYVEALQKLMEQKAWLLTAAEALIECLSDGKAREVCRYYYCVGESDEDIAARLESNRVVVCKQRNAAADWLTANIDPEKLTQESAHKGTQRHAKL